VTTSIASTLRSVVTAVARGASASGIILPAIGLARDVNRDGFRLGDHTDEPDGGASVSVRFPASKEISRIEHYDRGYRVHLRANVVMTLARHRST
jgi:hypothetical protein